MGKRKKSSYKNSIKEKPTRLDVIFDCPICNYKKSSSVKKYKITNLNLINRNKHISTITCYKCESSFKTINNGTLIMNLYKLIIDLKEPVDVYAEWLDACEEVNK